LIAIFGENASLLRDLLKGVESGLELSNLFMSVVTFLLFFLIQMLALSNDRRG